MMPRQLVCCSVVVTTIASQDYRHDCDTDSRITEHYMDHEHMMTIEENII